MSHRTQHTTDFLFSPEFFEINPQLKPSMEYVLDHIQNQPHETILSSDLKDIIMSAESHLTEYVGTSKNLIEQKRQIVKHSSIPRTGEQLFLKETAAAAILEHIPATNLHNILQQDNQNVLSDFSALEILAMARHTEDKVWQEQYWQHILTLSLENFEKRIIHVLYVPQSLHLKNKPWLLSHCKELGIISAYDPPHTENACPLLLFTLVFLHYQAEVLHSSRHVSVNSKTQPGQGYFQIVHNSKITLPDCNPNIFSETIFWRDAYDAFTKLFPSNPLSPYLQHDTLFNQSDHIIESCNIVDLLWDISFPHTSHTYHLKEALCTDSLHHFSQISLRDFNHIVLFNLDKTDQEVIDMLQSSHEHSR